MQIKLTKFTTSPQTKIRNARKKSRKGKNIVPSSKLCPETPVLFKRMPIPGEIDQTRTDWSTIMPDSGTSHESWKQTLAVPNSTYKYVSHECKWPHRHPTLKADRFIPSQEHFLIRCMWGTMWHLQKPARSRSAEAGLTDVRTHQGESISCTSGLDSSGLNVNCMGLSWQRRRLNACDVAERVTDKLRRFAQ